MSRFNTGNPLDSDNLKDLSDNAKNADLFSNDMENESYTDRFGRKRKTIYGMESEFDRDQDDRSDRFNEFLLSSGYQFVGDYAAGVELTEYNQVVRDGDGEFWRASGKTELPYTLTGAGVDEGGALVSVGDANLRQDLANPDMGAALINYLGRPLADRLGETVNIADGPDAVVGDGTSEDRLRLIAKLEAGAAAGKPVVVPAKIYKFNDWIPLPDKCQLVFIPGAKWVLTQESSLGGFVCGGYDVDLVKRPFTDVDIYGIDLDCSGIPGENGFNAVNAVGVRVYSPKIRGCIHSPTKLGGRAFQFEGSVVDGVHVYQPYIEDCSIGCNSQGDPSGGSEVARDINYYDVVMRNVDVPFNIDGQFANPQNGTLENCSTFVHGAALTNCGKLTFPGNAGAFGGGVICGDRGYGLSISGLRVFNTPEYGAIGALVRGTMFGVRIRDVEINVPGATAVFDFSMPGFGSASSADWPNSVIADGIRYNGNLDYVIKTGGSAGRIGESKFEVEINSALASLAGVVDVAGVTTALLDLSLSDDGFKSSGLRTLANIYASGNQVGICSNQQAEGTWTPVDGSGAGLTFSAASGYYIRNGREITATFRLDYPATDDTADAIIAGLPFVSLNLPVAGTLSIGFKSAPALYCGLVRPNTSSVSLFASNSATIKNNGMSGSSLLGVVTYLA